MEPRKPQLPTEFFEKAGAYEELVRIKGFSYLKAKMAERVQAFTNDALMGEGFKSMDEYRERRGEIKGMQQLLGDVQYTLDTLFKHREEKKDDESAG